MNRVSRAILALSVVVGVLLAASIGFSQATGQTAGQATAQTPPTGKIQWVSPIRGTVEIAYLKPDVKTVKGEVVTVIKVKNMSNGHVARLKVEEFWWDKNNNPVSSNQDFAKKPVGPGEVVTFTMTTPRDPRMYRNNYKFSHANGDIKPKQVPKF